MEWVTLPLIFLVIAIVLFVAIAFSWFQSDRVNLLALGLAFFAASFLPIG